MKHIKFYAAGLALVLAVCGAFTTVKEHKANDTSYWYTFNGTQTISGRQDKTQYINPTTAEPSCLGSSNECAVEVQGITGTPPSDISSLDITFSPTTGMPSGGVNFQLNAQKN